MEKKFNAFTDLVPDGGMTAILRSVAVFGDSLASGEQEYTNKDGSKGFYDDYDLSWGQFMARKCGLTVKNFSRGGLTAKGFQDLAHTMRAFYKLNRCNAYIIALGSNDVTKMDVIYPDGFGSVADIDLNNYQNNKQSFCGYYAKIIQQIKELEPFAKIFVTTLPKRHDRPDENVIKYTNMHAEFLRELPSLFDRVYVIDLNAQDFTVYTPEFNKKYALGGHMSTMGYKYMGDVIATYIDYIICENPQEFKSMGLIGTDFENTNYKK